MDNSSIKRSRVRIKGTWGWFIVLSLAILTGCVLKINLKEISLLHQILLALGGSVFGVICVVLLEGQAKRIRLGRFMFLVVIIIGYISVLSMINDILGGTIAWHIGVGIVVTLSAHYSSKLFLDSE